jgi:hypothetical protein
MMAGTRADASGLLHEEQPDRRQGEREQVGEEQRLASVLAGHPAEQRCAEEDADQGRGGEEPGPQRCDGELGGERLQRQRDADDREHVTVDEHPAAGDERQPGEEVPGARVHLRRAGPRIDEAGGCVLR